MDKCIYFVYICIMTERPPIPVQNFIETHPVILRCRYEKLESIRIPESSEPSWVLYWIRNEGFDVQIDGQRIGLSPSCVYILAPFTAYSIELRNPRIPHGDEDFVVRMSPVEAHENESELMRRGYVLEFFAHFTLGPELDHAKPGIYEIPFDRILCAALERAAETLKRIPGQQALDRAASCEMAGAALLAVARLSADAWAPPARDPRVEQALRVIRENPGGDFDTQSLARHAGLSRNIFTRRFHEEVGETPRALTQRLRVEKARLLLAHTVDSIEEVADQCGFCDRYYFTRVFRRATGYAPAAYRALRHRRHAGARG